MDRSVLALLALAALVAPAIGAAAATGASLTDPVVPTGNGFLAAPRRPDSVQFVVPEEGHVVFTIHVQAGSAVDLVVRGPPTCRLEVLALAAGPMQQEALRLDCGVLQPMNVDVSVGTTAGLVRGYIESAGAGSI